MKGGGVKLKVSKTEAWAILNFSSASRRHLDILGNLVKKLSLRFFKDGLVTELLRVTCRGGLLIIEFSITCTISLTSTLKITI